jgi:uncharacterized protein YjbI with pentapeptide repeats
MANSEHVARLSKGVQAWNAWRRSRPQIEPDLSGVEITGAKLAGIDLTQTDLEGAQLRSANLDQAGLREAYLAGADLQGASLIRAYLSEANLSGANLKGIIATNAFLRKTNFRGAALKGAQLDDADGWRACLVKADLTLTSMVGTILHEADLSEALLIQANLREAFLVDADLTAGNLTMARLGQAILHRVNLTNAVFGLTVFGDNNLASVKGLETAVHTAESAIDIATIYRSGGRIPEIFLRGCGVPDGFLIYMKSLLTNPVQFYSCFISYSTKDQAFADRLHADLQNKGVRCWFAPHAVQGGRKLHEQIDEAIRVYDKLLLILSPYSMKSEWVKTEIAKARHREVRDKRRVLFPIRLAPFKTVRDWECFDADTGKDSAREIREYFIPDFSKWKDHDSYQEAFQRLLSDLRASGSG